MINNFFTSSNILKLYNKHFKYLISLMIFFLIIGIYFSFYASPADYQQGELVRIMYVHVPSAWLALMIYLFIGLASLIHLIWRNPIFDIIAKSAAPIGVLFCFITLVTGSLWGKPTWGTWWVWDARLTSMLILFFFYIGYLSLIEISKDSFNNNAASVLAIIGCINVPIVKFSVNLWNSLHQPASVFKLSGPSIHKSMLVPLMFMFIAFSLYFLSNLAINVKISLIKAKMLRKNI